MKFTTADEPSPERMSDAAATPSAERRGADDHREDQRADRGRERRAVEHPSEAEERCGLEREHDQRGDEHRRYVRRGRQRRRTEALQDRLLPA
jgi:hypothetical protein